MKYDSTHGSKLSRALAYEGGRITEQAGVIFASAYHGLDMPLNGYEINEAERAACKVLDAIDAYRAATETKAPDPVINWPRPSYHKRAHGQCPDCGGSTLLGCHCFEPQDPPGMRASHMLPITTLAALNGDDTPDEAA